MVSHTSGALLKTHQTGYEIAQVAGFWQLLGTAVPRMVHALLLGALEDVAAAIGFRKLAEVPQVSL